MLITSLMKRSEELRQAQVDAAWSEFKYNVLQDETIWCDDDQTGVVLNAILAPALESWMLAYGDEQCS